MNTQSDGVNLAEPQDSPELPDWLPDVGVQIRKAGVQFDAIRLDGDRGREIADLLARMTGGDPGPVIETATGRRCVYFLVPPGSTTHLSWPEEVTRMTDGPDKEWFIPVPALEDMTWPLGWRYPPTAPDRLVHTRLLRTALHSEG